MPIRESEKARYPKNWPAIRYAVLARAERRCECVGQCDAVHEELSENAQEDLVKALALLARDEAPPHPPAIYSTSVMSPAPRCGAPHHLWIHRFAEEPWLWLPAPTGLVPMEVIRDPVRVVLTVAHLDHTPENCARENLLALCQFCHLRLDAEQHAKTRRTRGGDAPELPFGRDASGKPWA